MNKDDAIELLNNFLLWPDPDEIPLSKITLKNLAKLIEKQAKEITELKSLDVVIDLQSENAELKAKLEKAIIPKFESGQIAYWVNKDEVVLVFIESRVLYFDELDDDYRPILQYNILPPEDSSESWQECVAESELFATEEAALASLQPEGE